MLTLTQRYAWVCRLTWALHTSGFLVACNHVSNEHTDRVELGESGPLVSAKSLDELLQQNVYGDFATYADRPPDTWPTEHSAMKSLTDALAADYDHRDVINFVRRVFSTLPYEVIDTLRPFLATAINSSEIDKLRNDFRAVSIPTAEVCEQEAPPIRIAKNKIVDKPQYSVTLFWFIRVLNDALRAAQNSNNEKAYRVYLVRREIGEKQVLSTFRLNALKRKGPLFIAKAFGEPQQISHDARIDMQTQTIALTGEPMYRLGLDVEHTLRLMFEGVQNQTNDWHTSRFCTSKAFPDSYRMWVSLFVDGLTDAFCNSRLREAQRLRIAYVGVNDIVPGIEFRLSARPHSFRVPEMVANAWNQLVALAKEGRRSGRTAIHLTRDQRLINGVHIDEIFKRIALEMLPSENPEDLFTFHLYRVGPEKKLSLYVTWRNLPQNTDSLETITPEIVRRLPDPEGHLQALGCDVEDKTETVTNGAFVPRCLFK